MSKIFSIVMLIVFGMYSMPRTAMAFDHGMEKMTEEACCEHMQKSRENKDCCEKSAASHDHNDKDCDKSCDDLSCHCPIAKSILQVVLFEGIDFRMDHAQKNILNISQKQTLEGYRPVWSLPKIG